MKRAYLITSRTASYHAGNREQMNDRINAAHYACFEAVQQEEDRGDFVVVSVTTCNTVDNEVGHTTITVVGYVEASKKNILKLGKRAEEGDVVAQERMIEVAEQLDMVSECKAADTWKSLASTLSREMQRRGM